MIVVLESRVRAGVYFTPGDAFFHAAATTDEVANVAKLRDDVITMRYYPPESPPPSPRPQDDANVSRRCDSGASRASL